MLTTDKMIETTRAQTMAARFASVSLADSPVDVRVKWHSGSSADSIASALKQAVGLPSETRVVATRVRAAS